MARNVGRTIKDLVQLILQRGIIITKSATIYLYLQKNKVDSSMKKMKKERYTCITFFFQLIKGHTFFKVYTQKVSKIYTHTIFFQGFSLICKRLLALFI